MKLYDKLERKFGEFYIPNLMVFVVVGNLVIYLFSNFAPVDILSYLYFDRDLILQGQVWRAISFVFMPYSDSILFMLLASYFYFMIGRSLEERWGGFRFNLFYFCGLLITIIGGMITGFTTINYLNLSLFIAYAMIFPEVQFLLFFILPVKAKYIAYFDLALLAWDFITIPLLPIRVAIIAATINVLIFFYDDFFGKIRDKFRYRKNRRNFKIYMNKKEK